MKEFIIKNALIYDGTGSIPFKSDILVQGEYIKKVEFSINNKDIEIIDAEGLCVCPGFIDTHSHSDLEIFRDPSMKHVIGQGVTTEVIGQDGSSVAPVFEDIVDELADNMAPLAGTIEKPYWWRTYGEYLDEIKKFNSSTRIEGLIGHGTIRMCIMGNDNRTPTEDELGKMKKLVSKCMEEGAKGISLGLIYPPGSYANTDELIEICKVVAKYDGIMMVHMRNEQDKLLESIDEMACVARESKVRLHISHLKALGYKNWGIVRNALDKLYALKSEGIDVTFDQYPYTATCTGLKVVVPIWAYEGGEKKFQARLRDESDYAKILKEVQKNIENRGGADKILIATTITEKNKWMEGKDLKFISEKLNMPSENAALQMLKEEGPAVVAIYFSISEEDIKTIMQSDLHCVCTDGIMGSHPHPRLFGAFTEILGHYCRELNILKIEEAIKKMTSEPARRLRLWDRGIVREGMSADLVMFDAQEVKNLNSYLEPKKSPVGIKKVWVKGQVKK